MSIQNATILSGATVSATGGTTTTYAVDGVDVQNGIHVSDQAASDYRTRKGITFKARPPKVTSAGTYTKGKHSATLAMPRSNLAGAIEYPLVRIELEYSAENTSAEIDEMMKQAAQLAFDSDFTNFWRTGSRA